jgi:hypothetical protein
MRQRAVTTSFAVAVAARKKIERAEKTRWRRAIDRGRGRGRARPRRGNDDVGFVRGGVDGARWQGRTVRGVGEAFRWSRENCAVPGEMSRERGSGVDAPSRGGVARDASRFLERRVRMCRNVRGQRGIRYDVRGRRSEVGDLAGDSAEVAAIVADGTVDSGKAPEIAVDVWRMHGNNRGCVGTRRGHRGVVGQYVGRRVSARGKANDPGDSKKWHRSI